MFYFPSLLSCTLSVLYVVGAFGAWESTEQHIAEPLKTNQLVVVVLEEDGCYGGPEVLAGAGHL